MEKKPEEDQTYSSDEIKELISNFIVEKILDNEKKNKLVHGFILIKQSLHHENLKEMIHEKFGKNIPPLMFIYQKLEKEQIVSTGEHLALTNVGQEIINKYGTYLAYKRHIKDCINRMKPIEYCLDNILMRLEENWTRQKDGFIEWLNATELLDDFNLPGRHEFFKGLIRKLHSDGYVEYRDGAKEENNATEIDFFRGKTLITVKGYYFIKNEDGYTGELKRLNASKQSASDQRVRENQMNERLESIQKRNLILTIILAIGAGIASVYYLIEIVKAIRIHYPDFPTLN
jgi:hypothetical protein